MIEVIDDFLSPSYFSFLCSMFDNPEFPWMYTKNITNPKSNKENLNALGFNFSVLKLFDGVVKLNEDHKESFLTLPAIYYIQDRTGYPDILRSRFDMTLYNPNEYRHEPHIDINHEDFVSTILYMNDSDGDTLIYNERCYKVEDLDYFTGTYTVKQAIKPKANRLVIFDGHYVHTGHSPSKHKDRILLNCVFARRE